MAKSTFEETFPFSREHVFSACQFVVAKLGYSVLHSDTASGILTFNTGRSMKSHGGQDLTATLLPAGKETRLVIGGSLAKHGASLQLVSWGEKDALSKKFLVAVGEALRSGEVQAPSTTQTGGSSPSLSDEIAKLAALRDNGVLTQEEFDTAKARLLG